MKTAKRVFFGSSAKEYCLYDENGQYVGFWDCYHMGPLPKGYRVVYGQWATTGAN